MLPPQGTLRPFGCTGGWAQGLVVSFWLSFLLTCLLYSGGGPPWGPFLTTSEQRRHVPLRLVDSIGRMGQIVELAGTSYDWLGLAGTARTTWNWLGLAGTSWNWLGPARTGWDQLRLARTSWNQCRAVHGHLSHRAPSSPCCLYPVHAVKSLFLVY